MPITIKFKNKDTKEEKLPVQATVALQVTETLDGNLLISDHDKIDIIIMPSEGKIVTMPKVGAGDNIYEYQRDFINSLYRGGVVNHESIQGGPQFGVLEASYNIENDKVDPVQVALLEVEKYLKMVAGEDAKSEEYDKNIEDRFTDPDEDLTTELGEITREEDEPYRQSQVQGSKYSFTGHGYLY
jgi:hypothetical protein